MVRRLGLAAAASVAAVLGALACGGEGSHVYEGRLFDEARGCFMSKTSLDVVSGDAPGDCGPRCLVQNLPDGGRTVYGATMCAPFPFNFDATGTHPACPAALAALARGDACLSDGGSTNPLPRPADAGAD